MTATPTDVQTKLDAVKKALSETTHSYPSMVTKYGTDWTKWPATSPWGTARDNLAAARTEAGQLATPAHAPTAAFTYKEA